MSRRSLLVLANDAEDVASALHIFSDQLPRDASRITACISELFALSSILKEINNAEGDVQFASSFYQVQDDLTLLYPSAQRTLADAFHMFTRSRDRPYQLVWDDLSYKMDGDEGVGLLERLELYHHFLRAQADILQRRRPQGPDRLRNRIVLLLDAQRVSELRAERRAIDSSAASTPRPRPSRPRSSRVEIPTSPMSPTSASDTWSDYLNPGARLPPRAPEPPRVPTSPTYTFVSNSSRTFSSSETSYSSDQGGPVSPRLDHWVQNVFDGSNPGTPFDKDLQLDVRSSCHGTPDPQALDHLRRDGFLQAVEIPFNKEQCRVRLYFRPHDSRARLLFMTRDDRGRDVYYCTKLGNIKIVRNCSSLQLCRYKGNGRFSEWARLNFYLYERMVLFYCAFVAMKRQDSQPIPEPELLDEFELEGPPSASEEVNEFQEFGGVTQDGELLHALRLYRDQSSGVVRLEGSALRGPMKNVPLWTAFVTRYATDPDHVQFEGDGVVSFAAIKPPPYVFLAGYETPKSSRSGEHILQFTSDKDAREFVETWSGLCRSNRG